MGIPAGMGHGQNADMIGMIFEEDNDGYFRTTQRRMPRPTFGNGLVRKQCHERGC
jgi:hypothetical protein